MKKTIIVCVIISLTILCFSQKASIYAASTRTTNSAYQCSCGGKLSWTATAYKIYHTCSLCKGKRGWRENNRWVTCTNCKGSGQDYRWKSGYVCERCGKIYSD